MMLSLYSFLVFLGLSARIRAVRSVFIYRALPNGARLQVEKIFVTRWPTITKYLNLIYEGLRLDFEKLAEQFVSVTPCSR